MNMFSAMNSKVIDAIVAGELSFAQIAEMYNMSLADVNVLFEEYMINLAEYYGEDMDGDFDSAMASAGFGTDEDYGYYGDFSDDF